MPAHTQTHTHRCLVNNFPFFCSLVSTLHTDLPVPVSWGTSSLALTDCVIMSKMLSAGFTRCLLNIYTQQRDILVSHTLQYSHTHTLTNSYKLYSKPQPRASPAKPASCHPLPTARRPALTHVETCRRCSVERSPDSAFMGMFDVRAHKEQSVNSTPKYRDLTVSLRPNVSLSASVWVYVSLNAPALQCVSIYCPKNFPYVHIERMIYSLSMFKRPWAKHTAGFSSGAFLHSNYRAPRQTSWLRASLPPPFLNLGSQLRFKGWHAVLGLS